MLERQSEYPEIRGQAAEGLDHALGNAPRNLAWARRAETALINALDDPAVEVRWWSCFALSSPRSKRAVPKLRELAANDRGMLSGWWTVAEEAEDALLSIADKESVDRDFSGQRVWSWGQG